MKKVMIAAGIVVGACAFSAVPTVAAATQPEFICPDGSGWVKVDGPFGQTVFAPAPTGSLIVEVCYKAGPNSTTYIVEPVEGVSITSTLVNNGGQVADISHYSVRLVPNPEPTVTPTPEPTRTIEPTPLPSLIPPIVAVPDEPTLAPTGLEGWAWAAFVGALVALGLGFAMLVGKALAAVRSSHDSTTTGEQ